MIQDPVFYLLAVPAVVLLGFSKGGLAGVGSLALPLIVIVIEPVQAAAIMLPILIAQDTVGVWAFRRHLDWYVLGWTVPGATFGILLGYLFAANVPSAAVMALVGVISIAFGAYRLWLRRQGTPKAAAPSSPGWIGSLFGVASGFTSQIAHAGAPPFQLWVLPRRLPRDVLVGTSAVYFAVINWIKVPAFAALGQFSATNVLTAAALLPVAIVSTFAGVWLVRRIDGERFYAIIYCLMIVVGVILLFEAAA
ncbi:MAG TPA: sulfite exporter TauE/SafE family protein [Gammaproteobacteria bacterium]